MTQILAFARYIDKLYTLITAYFWLFAMYIPTSFELILYLFL